jgi:hypothetical protein
LSFQKRNEAQQELGIHWGEHSFLNRERPVSSIVNCDGKTESSLKLQSRYFVPL